MAVELTTVNAKLVSGLKVDADARGHVIRLDEPKNLGGTDTGMNPVEAVLSGLAACKLIVAKSFAAKNNINFRSIAIDMEGELDPDGFLGLNPGAKIGFSKIKTIYHIDSDHTEEEINNFIDFIDRTCPVLDTIINTPEFETEIR